MFIAMLAFALLVTYLFGPRPLLALVSAGTSADRQVGWGIVIGLAVAIAAWAAIRNITALAGFRDQKCMARTAGD
jgi:H+/Cl- antiporter ClcA